MDTDQTPILSADEVTALVRAKVAEHGSVAKAAADWGVTPQMVHMVVKGRRRPAPAMLEELQLEEVPTAVTYRRKGAAQ